MVDKNKLKRIKGILSARLGAEIPKYQQGAITPLSIPTLTDLQNSAIESAKNVSVGMNTDFEDQAITNALKQKLQQKQNAIAGLIALFGTQAFTAVGDALGAAQAVNDSELTLGITTGYKAVQNAVSNLGPIGLAVSGIMGIASATGDILQSMGGGTDLQSTLDKWMDSPLLSWNVGAINGFFGKNSDTFAIDSDAVESVGSSYGGTVSDLNNAAEKANKKYGLFSSKSRKKANDAIAKAKSTQNLMADIGDTAEDQRLAVQSMGELAGLAYSMMTRGGYDLKYTYAAKQGGILEWNPLEILEWEPQVELNWELPTFKEGGNIDITEELEWIPELQKGGKTRTLELLFEYAKKENPRFILRLSESPKGIDFIDENGELANGSHLLSYSTDNEGNAIVFPQILEMEDGSLHYFEDWKDAYDRAVKNKNILKMSLEEADLFFAEDPEYHTAYKRGWPEFFNEYHNFKPEDLESVRNFYKDYDTNGVNFIYDQQARTEGNNIYANSNESMIHELWHYLSQNKPNEIYKEFYDNLNDLRILELGGNLQFVNRTGNPSDFYHPSELEARVKAAKYKTPGLSYTKEFFRELRNNPKKFGDNMRDLLYMYNDENLEKIFNLKKGGSIKESELVKLEETNLKNVIPEGALHKNKHHMDHAEGLTKKGIPVIDEDGEQLAEIEHSEIIFTLEVTKKLEEYYDIFYSEESSNKEKEQAALDAGKLLVYQILENTEDRTGLIESCKKGGSLTLKKSTDDLIEEALEWIPTLMVVELVMEEVKEEEKPKKKSEKELMKEAIKEVLIELLTK